MLAPRYIFGFLIINTITKSHAMPLNVEEDVADEMDVNLHNIDEILKRLGAKLEKPKEIWKIPTKLQTQPSSCESLSYCQGESAPPPGKFYRHPVYPSWYYSCEGKKVKCHSCHDSRKTLDQLTLFYSERCQKCIFQYEDSFECLQKTHDKS